MPSAETLESQWLAQIAAFRQVISELHLPKNETAEAAAGADWAEHNVPFNDQHLWEIIQTACQPRYKRWTGARLASPARPEEGSPAHSHDYEWLQRRCEELAPARGLRPDELAKQIMNCLRNGSSAERLQAELAEVVGYDELDLVIDLIAGRDSITASESATQDQQESSARLMDRAEREQRLQLQEYEHKHASLAPATQHGEAHYPHVYKSHSAGNMLSISGRKYGLPQGSQHIEEQRYTEYAIPASRVGTLAPGRKLVSIAEMDYLCQGTFKGYQTLNRMQSLLYPVAYETVENMLVCAPTGAGKTDAAMLTILNVIARHATSRPLNDPGSSEYSVNTDDFKIVYVAPMKALAAEITGKLGKRLAWLGISARELTGDMQLTKREIMETQIIVTTPEKWDVVTRKSTGDTELVQKVKLLIIDEVHMLHDERGAVIESLVARTQRQVEATQSMIRIVGLSATLPNYIDVADFLKVNRMAGLFYFDQSFRPVPLEQHFVGVKGESQASKKGGAPMSMKARENLDITAYEKVKDMLECGHQVMVFVHSRKDTVNTAKMLLERAADEGCADLFSAEAHQGYEQALRDIKMSKGRELRELVPKGLGVHHAGMPRTDRNLIERLFSTGILKVLCCTATLAWGVNLPAAAVIIKGTQLYSAQDGKFIDLGILDVLQIFGRAGRPQFQDTGIGYIITTHSKLQHYLSAVTSQEPIESRFSAKLVDNLNAEIALGTVTSINEAVQWLGYSYMFVRMQRNPFAYGIEWSELSDDPQLVERRRSLVIGAARILQKSQMVIFNERTEDLKAKDVGRIASQYYVQQTSIEIFNEMMKPMASDADVLKMISMSGEFDNIQSRQNEEGELSRLREEAVVTQIEGTNDSPFAKTNILLQSYISGARIDDFALVSDAAYVAQNAARIARALFMIALNRRWGYQCLVLLSTCKSIEKRIWPFQHPFHQFDLPSAVMKNLDEKFPASSVESLQEMEPAEIGALVRNHRMGTVIHKLLDHFPILNVEVEIAPLNRDVLRMRLYLHADFRWNDRYHGAVESYWIWVENSETCEILHHEYFILSRRKLNDSHELNFTIPLSDPLPGQIYVRAISDRWLGAETVTPVSFKHLIRPDTESRYTDLLNLQPLPVEALKNPALEELYKRRFEYFNPMQSQIFHTLYHTSANVLLGSPTGSGKTVAAELAMWWAFRERPGSKVVYIAPMKALVRERVQDWTNRLAVPSGMRLVELTGDNTPDTGTIQDADIIITTPEKWDGISRSWQTRAYVRKVSLIIIDEIHLLGGDRGPILEIIVSRMNYVASQSEKAVRLVGMSTACANASDLANWLGVKQGLYNFRHSVRPVPLEIYIDGFPEVRGFCPFMASMNRPTFLAIRNHSPHKPVIVFVASRRQTRLTAKDLINYCGMEDNPRRFVNMPEEDLQMILSSVRDDALREALSFGIGLHHAGLVESDRQLAEELFANNKVQILIATSTLAWGVNLPAHLVVVKGTQYYDAKVEGYVDMDLTDVLQMLGRAGRPQFDSSGIARIFTQDSKKAFYKHFLHTGFPVESSLHKVLDDHLGAEISSGTITTKQDALDYLTWTFLFRRIHKNPTYYGLDISADDHSSITAHQVANDFLVGLVHTSLEGLAKSSCILFDTTSGEVDPTPFGRIMSYYYLSHRTIRHVLTHAKPEPTFAEALGWLCAATEFNDLPVRHNEDLINGELAKTLPLSVDSVGPGLPLWDPHVKAFLLLQAYFTRMELPISDYIGDRTSVLDQGIRIVQACIDVLTELGYPAAVRQLITVLQCIKAGRWPQDHPLSFLPGINARNGDGGSRNATSSVRHDRLPDTVVELLEREEGYLKSIPSKHGFSSRDASAFVKAVAMLPRLTVAVETLTATQLTISLTRRPALKTCPRQSGSIDGQIRIYSSTFPKPQTEGWFVLVTSRRHGTEEIIALKRVSWSSHNAIGSARARATGTMGARTVIKLPAGVPSGGGEEAQTYANDDAMATRGEQACSQQMQPKPPSKIQVQVISDSYPGMEWTIQC